MEKRVFRPGIGRWFGYAWLAFVAFNLVDLGLRGDDKTSLVIGAVLLLLTAVVYVTALRPRIAADASGVRIVNPLRDIVVPWGAVTEVDALDMVRVHTGEDRHHRCWAVQAQNRQRRRAHRQRAGGGMGSRGPGSGGAGRWAPGSSGAGRPGGGSPSGGGARRTSSGPDPEIAQRLASRTHADYVASELDEMARRARRDAAPGRTETVTWSGLSLGLLGVGVALVLAVALIP